MYISVVCEFFYTRVVAICFALTCILW